MGKAQISVSNHFVEEKKHAEHRSFVPNHSGEDKKFEIPFRTLSHSELRSERSRERKLLETRSNYSRTKKNTRTTLKKHFSSVFRSVPFCSISFRTSEWAILRHTEIRERSTCTFPRSFDRNPSSASFGLYRK